MKPIKPDDQNWEQINKNRLEDLALQRQVARKDPNGDYIIGDLKNGAAMRIAATRLNFTVHCNGEELAYGNGVIRPEGYGQWLYDCVTAVLARMDADRKASEAGLPLSPRPATPEQKAREAIYAGYRDSISRAIKALDGDPDLVPDHWHIGNPDSEVPAFIIAADFSGYAMFMQGAELRAIDAPDPDAPADEGGIVPMELYYCELRDLLEATETLREGHELLRRSKGPRPLFGHDDPRG